MRRTAVALMTLAAVLVAALASVPAGHARTAVICPLSAAATGTCCGPPIVRPNGAYCCAAACTPPLTISVRQTIPPVAGQLVTVYGTVHGPGAGRDVALWRRPGGGRFGLAANTTTDAAGNYSFTLHPRMNQAVYVTFGSLKTRVVEVPVGARLSTDVSSLTDGRLVISGSVYPNHAREWVVLQRAGRARTVSIARRRLDRRSRFRFVVRPRWEDHLWVLWPGDRRNARSTSGQTYVHSGGQNTVSNEVR